MEIFKTREETFNCIKNLKTKGKTIGFIPTMGALHEGHLELMRSARNDCDTVIVSIFVNPIQFNNKEDLSKYPRDIESDIAKLKTIPCDILFNPSEKEMYPDEVTENYDFGNLETVMEGKFRPGHFKGVAIVVKRLFDIVQPDRAYFGEKDYQQLRIIQELVRQHKLPVNIIACPTVREKDGLAMSSRNQRLTRNERQSASLLYKALSNIKMAAFKNPLSQVLQEARKMIQNDELFELEYLIASDTKSLAPVNQWFPGNEYVICLAAQLGKVRLIDNVIIR